MTSSVRRLRDYLVRRCLNLGLLVPLLPARWRSRVVVNLSSELLIQAIGNLESRDDLFWLRREVWRLAQQVLGLGDGYDRSNECGWQLALETEIASAIFLPVVTHHYRLRRPGIREPIDRLLRERWSECCDRHVWSTREAKETKRRARELDRRWRTAKPSVPSPLGVLTELRRALRRDASPGRGAWGLIVARRGFLASRTYDPVLTALRELGVAVIWVELGDDYVERVDRAAVTSLEHPWGLELHVSLPLPEELTATFQKSGAQYLELLDQVRGGYRRLPPPLRWIGSRVEMGLPISVHGWLAAFAVAELILDEVPLRFIHVQADKDVTARAFIMAARARRVEASYYYRSLELGAPSYWPIADRILVANAARAGRLCDLGVPRERIVAVGSLELDHIVETTREVSRDRLSHPCTNVVVLTKWPASLFFGDLDRLGRVLSAMVRLAPHWHWIVKPHPKDATEYNELSAGHPGHVEVRHDGYAELIAGAGLVVSAMGNSVFHALAAGKPLVVFNPDPRINLGHDRLFARPDLPPQVRLAQSWAELLEALQAFASGQPPLTPYEVGPSIISDLFHSLDGATAERISATLVGAGTPILRSAG